MVSTDRQSHWKECHNFVDKSNVALSELHATCDRLAMELQHAGIGAKVKHAVIVTPAEDDQLWYNWYFQAQGFAALCVLCW